MYYAYFGLKQPPFKITPDTSLFFPGGNRGAVLEALVYAIVSGEGIVKVVGEVGSGKTMLCRMLQEELPASVEIVYLANPSLSPENILHAIAFELNLSITPQSTRLQVMQALQQYLLEKHSANQQVVVFVEEAQSMPIATLEEIRLLSNLETRQNKLLQIILFGQPELDEMIAQREIRQLKERITYSFHLNPFKINDINDYLNTRLRACGYRSGEMFSRAAVRKIRRYSKGLVRRINILADKSMLAAYASNAKQVTAAHVKQAARDSEFMLGGRRLWIPSLISSLLVVLAAGLFFYGQSNVGSDELGEQSAAQRSQQIVSSSAPVQKPFVRTDEQADVTHDVATVESIKILAEVVQAPKLEDLPADTEINAKSGSRLTLQMEHELSNASALAIEEGKQARHNEKVFTVANKEENVQPTDKFAKIEQQLIGLDQVYALQELGNFQFSRQELQRLTKQLQDLPPEVAYEFDLPPVSGTCKLCWSIIYRPLQDFENL